jgi:hypothetical protein
MHVVRGMLCIALCIVLVMASRALEERALKKQRAADLVQSGGNITTRKLERIVSHLQDKPEVLQYKVSRRSINAVHTDLHDRLAARPIDIDLEGGKILGKGRYEWQFLDVGKSLDYYCTECQEFASVIVNLFNRKPPTRTEPWDLALYCDETTPGDPPRLDQLKKTMMVYASIVQLGPGFLKHEGFWLPIVAIRTSLINVVPGGGQNVQTDVYEYVSR